MKTTSTLRIARGPLLAVLFSGLTALNGHAQFVFDSGSDQTYGAMNITANTTLPLPPDGKFNCTTITVASNATLRFTPNALNTPVYLLASGDVVINGAIDVSGSPSSTISGGAGGPGGFAGGNPGGLLAPGDGYGPGAGLAGTADSATVTNAAGFGSYGSSAFGYGRRGAPYGSPLLVPLVGGSGGGGRPSRGGTGGGGAVLIASSTRILVAGAITANPGYSCGDGMGSGGAIRLVTPSVSGTGALNVSGYDCYSSGSSGRIRIDCVDRRSIAFSMIPASLASIGANMASFPTNAPRLDITEAAGNSIAVGTSTPVFFMLPQNSSTNQTVKIQASNFGGVVPIRVMLTPDNGPSSWFDAEIDNSGTSLTSMTVPVTVPGVNVRVQVNVWTR